MKQIVYIICSLFVLSTISSVSWALPDCPSSGYYHNCFGTWRDGNGYEYVGEWKDDLQHGRGAATFANGDKFVGEYKNGKKHGQGTYIYTNGEKYVGEYKDNVRHGQGTNTWGEGPNKGGKYVGEWKDDKRNGQGTNTWGEGPNKGEKFIGEWKDDKMHGQGTYSWTDGTRDVGEFKNGKLNGYAITYNADGTILKEGIFKDDVFQYAQKKPPNGANSNSKLNKYKQFCEEIGFRIGTEKFADCVLKAMEKD